MDRWILLPMLMGPPPHAYGSSSPCLWSSSPCSWSSSPCLWSSSPCLWVLLPFLMVLLPMLMVLFPMLMGPPPQYYNLNSNSSRDLNKLSTILCGYSGIIFLITFVIITVCWPIPILPFPIHYPHSVQSGVLHIDLCLCPESVP